MTEYATLAGRALTVVLQHVVLSGTKPSGDHKNPETQLKKIEVEWQTLQLQYPWLPSIGCEKRIKFQSIKRAIEAVVIDKRMLDDLVPLQREEALNLTKHLNSKLHQQMISASNDSSDFNVKLYSARQLDECRIGFLPYICMILTDAQYRFLHHHDAIHKQFIELQIGILDLFQKQSSNNNKSQQVVYQLKAFEILKHNCFDCLQQYMDIYTALAEYFNGLKTKRNCQTIFPHIPFLLSTEDVLTSLNEMKLKIPAILDNIVQYSNDQIPSFASILLTLIKLVEKIKHQTELHKREDGKSCHTNTEKKTVENSSLNNALSESLSILLHKQSMQYIGLTKPGSILPYYLKNERTFLSQIVKAEADVQECRFLRAQCAFCWLQESYNMRFVTAVLLFQLTSILFPCIPTSSAASQTEIVQQQIRKEWTCRIEDISLLLIEAHVSGNEIDQQKQAKRVNSCLPAIRFLRHVINDCIREMFYMIYYSGLLQAFISNDPYPNRLQPYQKDIVPEAVANYSYLDHIRVLMDMWIDILQHHKLVLNQCIDNTLQDAHLAPAMQEAWSFLPDPPLFLGFFRYRTNASLTVASQVTLLQQLHYTLDMHSECFVTLVETLNPQYPSGALSTIIKTLMVRKRAIQAIQYTIGLVQHGCGNVSDGTQPTVVVSHPLLYTNVLIGRLVAWIYSCIFTHLMHFGWVENVFTLDTTLQDLVELWKQTHVPQPTISCAVMHDQIIMKLLALSIKLAVSGYTIPATANGSSSSSVKEIPRLWGNGSAVEMDCKFKQATVVQAFVCIDLIKRHSELHVLSIRCTALQSIQALLLCYQQWQRIALELMHLYIEDKSVEYSFFLPSSTKKYVRDEVFAFTESSSSFIELVSKAITILTPCKQYVIECASNPLCWSDRIKEELLTDEVVWLMQSMSNHKAYCDEMMQNEAVERRHKYINALNTKV